MDYKAGDILLIKTGGPMGAVIRWFTGSPYNHAAFMVSDHSLIEARPPCVGLAPASKWEKCDKLVLRPVNPPRKEDLKWFIDRFKGRWYGFLQIIGYIPVLRGSRKHNPLTDGTVCFELLHRAVESVLKDKGVAIAMDRNTCTGVDWVQYFKINKDRYTKVKK